MGRFDSLELDEEKETAKPSRQEQRKQPYGEKRKGADDFLTMALASMQLCDFEKALQMFSRALSFDNNSLSAWFGQLRCLIHLGEFKEATMWADKAIENLGETPELLAAKSCAYCRMGDFSRAYGLSDVSMEKKGSSPFVWLCRGEILLQQKGQNYGFCFDQALVSPGESWQIMVEIARTYMFYGKAASALTYLELALEDAPSKALVWYELGNCYADLGLKNKALNAFDKAVELAPEMKIAEKKRKKIQNSGFFENMKRKFFA
ncbi:MAG: tetratricopeptide repeat protein [Kiritimatiellaeota bacterium]|nr:tetratricopeptide repeat protein [Kiritimatiellota bacterium]